LLKGIELAKEADKPTKKGRRCQNQIQAQDPHGRLRERKPKDQPTDLDPSGRNTLQNY
jgi:hypothetical protein